MCSPMQRLGTIRDTRQIVRDTPPSRALTDPRTAQRPRSEPGPWMHSDEYLGD